MKQLLLALLAVLAPLAPVGAVEQTWSRFRGPNGSGVAADASFPATWAADDYQWQVSLPGVGHSSPVAWEDRVFLTAANPETAALELMAIAADSGKTLWSVTFEGRPQRLHAANSYASSTCAVDGKRVYIAWVAPESLMIAALDHAGQELWRQDLGPVECQHGFGVSPIVLGDLVIVANAHSGEGAVTALDAATGRPRWQTPRAGGVESYATPAVWRGADGSPQIIVHSSADGMAALAPENGEVLWQLPDVFSARCVASPIVAGGMILGGSGEGGNGKDFVAVRPPAAGATEPTIEYQIRKGIAQAPTPVANGGLLFILTDRGLGTCFDLATGDVHWTERVGSAQGGNYFASPVIAGGKLYCIAADGQATVLAASDKFEVLGRASLGQSAHATPMIHRGKMYFRTASSLACLPAESSP